MRISDQSAAIKLAICDDIGERSYDVTDVAAILVQMLTKIPAVGMCIDCLLNHCLLHMASNFNFCSLPGAKSIHNRYKIDADTHCGSMYVFLSFSVPVISKCTKAQCIHSDTQIYIYKRKTHAHATKDP